MSQIVVKFFKLLNPPPSPAEPNSVYLVQPDPAAVIDIYVTNTDGTVRNVGNAGFVQGLIGSYKTKTAADVLLSTTVVNLNEGTAAKQALYTVPASSRAIITRVDVDKLTAAPSAVQFTMGWNAAATDALDPFQLSDLVDAATKFGSILVQPTAWLVGTAAQVLGLAVSTPQGSALTARINLFGYLTDDNGMPIANV